MVPRVPLLMTIWLAAAPGALAAAELRLLPVSQADCESLAGRFDRQPGAGRDEPRDLAEEGLRLCRAGQFRAGALKLRRAIRAAHAPTPPVDRRLPEVALRPATELR